MTSLPPFLTLWILVEFAGSSDEDISMIKVRTKREKRPKTWSLRLDLLTIKMCTWDNKPWRVVLRCWCLTSVNHEVVCGDDREIFVTIIGGNFEFDLVLLQLWNKIALSSRWPPSFKSLQITSSFLSLCSHIEHKALENVPASGFSLSDYDLWRIRFWEVEMDFPIHGSQLSFGLSLQVCSTWYVGMCLNNGYSRASVISGFILCCCYDLVRVFVIAFLSLKCWLEDKLR